MITQLDINKAINNKIKKALIGTEFSNVPLNPADNSEIKRPCLKVMIENSTSGKFNASCKEKTLTTRVYFYAKDRYKYKIDNTKMQDIIESAFLDDLEVEQGFYIPIEAVESEVVDTILVCSFDLYAVELLPEPTMNNMGEPIEPMEQLDIKL